MMMIIIAVVIQISIDKLYKLVIDLSHLGKSAQRSACMQIYLRLDMMWCIGVYLVYFKFEEPRLRVTDFLTRVSLIRKIQN